MHLFECQIKLGQSAVYIHIGVFSYALAILFVCLSGLYDLVKIAVIIILIWQFYLFYRCKQPNNPYQLLQFNHGQWHLFDRNHHKTVYLKHRIILETGIFLLLELTGTVKRQLLVIFIDQLSTETYRKLKIIEKIN